MIANNFADNFIAERFERNQIANDFTLNAVRLTPIGNDFHDNNIGNGFTLNALIGIDFQHNIISNNCRGNVIGDTFQNNSIEEAFQENTIGNNFRNNVVANQFINNVTDSPFARNIVGFKIRDCIFSPDTQNNEWANNNPLGSLTGIDYTLATLPHITSPYTCYIFIANNGDSYLEYYRSAGSLWDSYTPANA